MDKRIYHYTIFKCPISCPYKFQNSEFINKYCDTKVSLHDYVVVYSGSVRDDITVYELLDELFFRFNASFPNDYYSSSMSVSDIIRVREEDGCTNYYYVDSIGFKKLTIDNGLECIFND